MLAKIFNHFVAPRAALAAAKLTAALAGQSAFRVPAENMEPTVSQGAICRYRRIGSKEQISRGSIVAFTIPEFEGFVVPSRVLAVAGEIVHITRGQLFVNEQRVTEPYLKVGFASAEYSTHFPPHVVPEDSVFLLGDNRDASKDSRHLGSIPRAAILGLVISSAP